MFTKTSSDMDKNKLPLKEWEESINKMGYEELQRYIADPEICYPEFLELAQNRLKELEVERMRDDVIKILTEFGWQCEINEDDYINFYMTDVVPYSDDVVSYFNDADFFISLDAHFRYIEINECCWKIVKLDDIDEVERLKQAINHTNLAQSVTISYLVNEEKQTMEVCSSTNMPYLSDEEYLKEYLDKKLNDIYCSNKLLDHILEKGVK